MTTESKKWWRKVVAVVVGGGIVAVGLFGIVRATAEPQKTLPVVDNGAWARSSAPVPTAAVPSVSEVDRSAGSSPSVVQASVAIPIPLPGINHQVAPAVPVAPLIPALPSVPVVDLPTVLAAPLDVKPVVSPAGLVLPPVPHSPSVLPITPSTPTGLPPLPGATVEPPKAPMVPSPVSPPTMMPGTPVFPPPVSAAPPSKLTDPVQPLPVAKPDSGLNPIIPGNTLNPPSPVAPAVPIVFPPLTPGGREVPGTPVDRAKPTDPPFGTTDRLVFPVPTGSNPQSLTPRETAMLNLKHTAALAVIGGAMFTAENARSAALFPPIVPVVPTAPVRGDADTDKLKKDLEEANKKVATLEKQVAKLTELLTGKKDELGLAVPSDPGAVAEIKRLADQVKALDTELKALKSQTALKPVIVPEVKPKGIVKVVNEYPVEISMVINDKSHRIAPNTKIEVEVPAGDFSYHLLQSGAAATRSVIKDKETVTLRIK